MSNSVCFGAKRIDRLVILVIENLRTKAGKRKSRRKKELGQKYRKSRPPAVFLGFC